jgi:hypothetical protein
MEHAFERTWRFEPAELSITGCVVLLLVRLQGHTQHRQYRVGCSFMQSRTVGWLTCSDVGTHFAALNEYEH